MGISCAFGRRTPEFTQSDSKVHSLPLSLSKATDFFHSLPVLISFWKILMPLISQKSIPKRSRVSMLVISANSSTARSESEEQYVVGLSLIFAFPLPLPLVFFPLSISKHCRTKSDFRSMQVTWLSRARYLIFCCGKWEMLSAANVRLSI